MADSANYIKNVTMQRWLLASRRLEMSTDEIMDSSFASVIVAACQKAGEETGDFDQYARFLNSTLSELTEFLTDGEPEGEPEAEADKSNG